MRSGERRRGKQREPRARRDDEQHLQHALHEVEVGQPLAWYWPQSQSENGESRPIWKPTVRSKKTRAACSGDGSRRSTKKTAAVATRNPSSGRSDLARPQRIRVPGPERQQEQRRELRPARERDERAAAEVAREHEEAPDEQRGRDRVVGVRARRVLRERPCRPRERAAAASRGPPKRRPTSASPNSASRSNRIDVKWTDGQRVPLVRSSRRSRSRGCRRGTTPARTCRRAGSRSRTCRSSGCGRAPLRSCRRARTWVGDPRQESARTGSRRWRSGRRRSHPSSRRRSRSTSASSARRGSRPGRRSPKRAPTPATRPRRAGPGHRARPRYSARAAR